MKTITINKTNVSKYTIRYVAGEPESTAFAAEELARYVKAACGAELPIAAGGDLSENSILLGGRRRLQTPPELQLRAKSGR